MPLNKTQKKQLKKQAGERDFKKICKDLNCSSDEALAYLKKVWKPKKFENFENSLQTNKVDNSQKEKIPKSLLKFLSSPWVYVFLIFLVVVSYTNALTADFVSDDIQAILQNNRLTDPAWIFRMPLYFLRDIFYALITTIFGKTPAMFRLLNILFHTGSVVLIFRILSKLENKVIAFVAAAVFAVHPILIEGVTWISGGPYAQYTFFFLLAFSFYIKQGKKNYYISIFFFLLCLISSEKSFVTSGVFYIYEITYGNKTLIKGFKRSAPFLTLGVLWTLYYAFKLDRRYNNLSTFYYNQKTPGFVDAPIRTMVVGFSKYVELLVWPQKLTLYQTKFNTTPAVLIFDFLLAISYISAVVWAFFSNNKKLLFWLLFFIIPLLPFILPLGVAWIAAERYTYMGSIAVFVGLGFIVSFLVKRFRRFIPLILTVFFIYISILSIRSIVRNNSWRNEDKLWKATVSVSDNSPKAYNNMGDVYFRAGDLDNAIISFENAIQLHPNNADFRHNLANVYRAKNDFDNAIKYYNEALEMNPYIWQSQVNLAEIYIQLGELNVAAEYLERSLEITGPREPTLLTLGNIYKELGDNEKAVLYYQKVLEFNPTNIQAQNGLLGL